MISMYYYTNLFLPQDVEEAVIVMIILPMQLVPITTNFVGLNPTQARCTRYNIMR